MALNENMAAPAQKTFLRQPDWIVAGLITAAVIWLHFFFLIHAGGLWRDEVNLVNLAGRHSLGDMAKDSFPLLMPLIVRGWSVMGPGHGEAGLRLLGGLIGMGIVAALWAAAWTARRSPPLLGLVLLALNSTFIIYGDSLRAYGLGSLLIVLTARAACAFLQRSSPARAGWLALFAVLSVQALYPNAILVGAICAGSWAVCARRKAWRAAALILGAGMAAAASLLPYVPNMVAGRSSTEIMRTGLRFTRVFGNLANAIGFPLQQYIYAWALLAMTVIACSYVVLCRKAKTSGASRCDVTTDDDARLFAGATAFVAFAGFAGFLWFAALPTQPWYFLPLMALAAMCFDAGLLSLPRLLSVALLGFVAATALIAIPTAQRDLNYRFTNVDLLARQLAGEVSPRDFVVVTPWFCGVSFNYYFKSSTPWTTLPPLADHSTHRYDLVRAQMQKTNAIQPVLDQITTALQSDGHVWVVAAEGWMDVPDPGTPSPFALPPPPLKATGWSDLPYAMEWSSQTAHFIGNHSRQFERIKSPATGILHIGENLELFVASGWKDSSQPVSTLNSETNQP
jgi:hypothetical protein